MDKIILRGCQPILRTSNVTTATSSHRLLHLTPNCQRYQINYDQLRDGSLANLASHDKDLLKKQHDSVVKNVKNVQGFQRGAERGFTSVYTDCIHVLTAAVAKDVPDLAIWFRKVLAHNLGVKVLNQRYGILVPVTYKHICPTASRDDMNQAHILGWCVELVRAASFVTTQTIAMDNTVRYGRTNTQKEQVTWADRHKLGNMAFNDALLIERGVFVLLKHYFGNNASIYYDAVLKAQNSRVFGRALGYSLLDNGWRLDGKEINRLSDFNLTNYKALTKSHVAATNYCLPISLAFHLANKHDEKLHDLAHKILNEIGYYGEVTRDFVNGFIDKDGTDIQDGRLTSLIAIALQRANAGQRKLLEDNYGFNDDAKVDIVKQVYAELKLKNTMIKYIDAEKSDIYSLIQGISKLDEAGLSQEFFFQLVLENLKVYSGSSG